MWDEGKICPRRIASAPPSCRLRLGGHPKSAGTPRPSPAAAAPTCLWGRGRRGGPDVTGGLGQSERSLPSPRGIPGPQQGPGARPGRDDPPPGAPKRGPRLGPRGGGPGCGGQAGPRGPRDGQRGRESHSGRRAGCPFPAGAWHRGRSSGVSGPLRVSPAPATRGRSPAALGTRCQCRGRPQNPHRIPPGRIWTGARCCPARSSDGETEAQGAGLRFKSQTGRMLLALVTSGEALPLPGPP